MKTIKSGDTGEKVRQIQTALQIGVDGKFGNLTELSVRKFQDQNDLEIDGVVGPLTWKALKIDEVKENLLITILDNAEPAVLKAKPKRKVIVFLSIILGGIMGIATILVRHSGNSQKRI